MRDEDMVRVLLQSQRISPNNRLLLSDYDTQLRSGFLANKDRNFIRALYAWFEEQERQDDGADSDAASVAEEAARISTVQALRMQLTETRRRVEALQQRADADAKRIAMLQAALQKAKAEPEPEDDAAGERFKQAKRAFARLFHPDHLHGSDLERQIRADMFKTFWSELERIERKG